MAQVKSRIPAGLRLGAYWRLGVEHLTYTSYSLNSLKGGYIGDYIGDDYRGIKGDTRSLDSGSYS